MHHTFRGRRFRIERRRLSPERFDGRWYARDALYESDGVLTFQPHLRGQRRLDAELHEMLHACFPDLDEDAVGTAASDMARFLWRVGYRCESSAASPASPSRTASRGS